MVTIIHGSSHFRPIGQTAITGPTGPTGPIGLTGPTSDGHSGATGFSGGSITNMYIVDDDKLHTIFTLTDGTTAGYTTTTRIKGPTGDTYNLIDGGNTHDNKGGGTFAKSRYTSREFDNYIIKSIEVTGDSISLVQDNSTDTINIHFDMGNFGYLDVNSGTERQLVGTDTTNDLWLSGVVGTTYDVETNSIEVEVQDYKEKIKYLTVGAGGSNSDMENQSEEAGASPLYAPPRTSAIDPNVAKNFILDMRQFDNVASDGHTGGIQLRFRDAQFGYTGNGPATSNELSKAFTLIVHGGTSGYETVRFDGSNVIWPFDKEPCWSGKTDIFNFFWLPCEPRDLDNDGEMDKCISGAAWHGNIIQWESQNTTMLAGSTSDPFNCGSVVEYNGEQRTYPFMGGITGATGACCVGGGICVYTTNDLCTGYYYGAGTTCGAGGTGSVCYENGACCVTNKITGESVCYNYMTSDECIDIGKLLNNSSAFGGTGSVCDSMECDNVSSDMGACCDGRGGCEQLTRQECLQRKNYFMGIGLSCNSDINICSGGTGACCYGAGNCINGVSGSSCISDGNLYAGNNSVCGDITCRDTTTTSGCVTEISGLDLKPGDLYAGGMVVGLYRPQGSKLFGASSFGGSRYTSWQELMSGSSGSTYDTAGLACNQYISKYDYHGYGFDSVGGCLEYNSISAFNDNMNKADSYYIIVSLNPVGITGDREMVNPDIISGATSEFFWGNRGSSWGPLYNQITERYDDISDDYKSRIFRVSEGYWYNQNVGETSLNNLANNTFSSCRKARRLGNGALEKLQTKSINTAHGLWHRNWGMYNTIRIISADNALYKGYNYKDEYSSADFGPGLTAGYVSAFRATRLLDDELITATGDIRVVGATGNNSNNISGWYLPSHDELSYIASNCIGVYDDFKLNEKLFEVDASPIRGWHWTSTGAFDSNKGFTAGIGEGIINPVGATGPAGVTADPGTLAWAINFDINGIPENFRAGKKDRTYNTYQVRPIRLVRCDGNFATKEDTNYKVWKLPNILRDEDRGINQRY